MEHYKIITDEQVLKSFIDWLPELAPHEKYYFSLFARSKYASGTNVKSDKAQLKRGVADKERLFQKIRQLEVPVGAYLQKGKPIPQEALALYIKINPRDMQKAALNTLIALAQNVRDGNGSENPHQEALSQIQQAKSRTYYIDFDIDEKNPERLAEIVSQIEQFVNKSAITLLSTRGGIHCLIDPTKIEDAFRKSFYQNISAIPEVDQTGDQLIPVPGTFQGGYMPHFI